MNKTAAAINGQEAAGRVHVSFPWCRADPGCLCLCSLRACEVTLRVKYLTLLWIPPEAAAVIYGAGAWESEPANFDHALPSGRLSLGLLLCGYDSHPGDKLSKESMATTGQNFSAWPCEARGLRRVHEKSENPQHRSSALSAGSGSLFLSFPLLRSSWTYGTHTCQS